MTLRILTLFIAVIFSVSAHGHDFDPVDWNAEKAIRRATENNPALSQYDRSCGASFQSCSQSCTTADCISQCSNAYSACATR